MRTNCNDCKLQRKAKLFGIAFTLWCMYIRITRPQSIAYIRIRNKFGKYDNKDKLDYKLIYKYSKSYYIVSEQLDRIERVLYDEIR